MIEAGATGRERWKIVLAEDDDDHALLIEWALERASPGGVEVHRARNGEEAVDLVEEAVPDLVLLDLKMPGRTGHEVLEYLKGDDRLRKIPIAVLTSSDRDEDVARSYGLGGNHFITKPENPEDLERRLGSLLQNLAELSGIRRGAEGLEPSAVSAVGPATFTLRRLLGWGAAVVIVLALAAFAYLSGAFD
ncbi:MAG: response regulator [Gemmatimonadetes bacterium]|nr:response regulator [Gemmatimonadota bacterium]NIR80922.1 response regulator [Gemmatimonadota bacterium]NIT89740.1 response regulator [Gemmatimonadota bacterium]NIU33526.1 response regulator [Gemmatimonadota bacterium]NIU37796.1 response regulator [Gemmatimonadota bacterium]